jgi:tetratricopeptide (TPR) repeat protein
MSNLRYRAFLSYSHQDENWAVWAHRALETYRLPRKLVGKQTSKGKIPDRVQPVFRDRDDLPTSSHLADAVKLALKDSANLILICSPAAAQSRWVNEEIREFVKARGADRIFCLVVDGEPGGDPSVDGCFPSALSEVGIKEPLAADARKWADGKHLAKLKLVAGMLGIRLDELRQRDRQRQRKRHFVFGLGVVAALVLAGLTVASRIAENNEREKAEQLATFVVDLGERLQTDADLETLALISSEAARNLQRLDQNKLSPNTSKKVALALRQMGRVSELRSKPEEALESYQRSRDILQTILAENPETADFQFELGNAEYYIGNIYFAQGEFDLAMKHMGQYFISAEKLLAADPQNPDWIMELSYAHNNLAAVRLESGKGVNAEVLEHVSEATRLMEEVLAMKPDDPAVGDGYATILAWAADAQLQACNLEEAGRLRKRGLELTDKASTANPANNAMKANLAFAITGLARIQRKTGDSEVGRQGYVRAISILEQLSKADPSNLQAFEDYTDRRVMLFSLLADTGQLELARISMELLAPVFETKPDEILQVAQIDYLISAANVELQSSNKEAANTLLKTAAELQKLRNDSGATELYDEQRSTLIEYLWWEANGSMMNEQILLALISEEDSENEFRGCREASSAAHIHVIKGQKERAQQEVDYLLSKGYADPAFLSFCSKHGLCSTSGL